MELFVLDEPNNLHSMRIVPVGQPQNPNPQAGEVCFWGGYSRHVCGKLSALSTLVEKPRP